MHKSTAYTGMIAMMTMVTLMSTMLNVIFHVLATLMPKTHPTQLLLSVVIILGLTTTIEYVVSTTLLPYVKCAKSYTFM